VSGKANPVAETTLRDARAAWERGDETVAERRCRDALAADPDDVRAWVLLGAVLRRRNPDEARAALTAAIQRSPQHPDAWFQLGNLHREARRFGDAIAAYETAALAAAESPALHNNLGLALEGAGETVRAEAAYRTALARVPGHRQALGNLAHLLCARRQYAEASLLCDDYLRRFPDAESTVWIDRGICLHHAGNYDAAEASFARALALEPGDPVAMTNLASMLVEREEFERAELLLAQALSRRPSGGYALSLLAHCRAHLCAWEQLPTHHAALADLLEGGSEDVLSVFALLSTPLSPKLQLRAARAWARDLGAPVLPKRSLPRGQRTERLRIGYVSSDFRTHATASLLAEVWEMHDRSRVETHAYSIGPAEVSALRRRIEAGFDHFVDVSAEPPEEIARRISEDAIDVLIDLNGHTTYSRGEIFSVRPAPVQVSWLGYLGTLGAPWYDYVLTDRFAAPPELQQFFTERFLYLPDCYCPSDTRRPIAAAVPTRADYELPEQAFVFCCFNSAYKILPEVFAVWMRLLDHVSDSVLWLSPSSAKARENLRRQALARGIAPERLVFAPRVAPPDHLARHAHADLFLDTTPYNAGATANDALFMGVPLVTCAGESMASRVAGSQLRAIGLPDLVTTGLGDYEALALELARDRDRLAGLKARLAANRSSYPLFDMPRFTRALEDLLLASWENRSSFAAS
jgi:protein O-GlcNAc transferase